MNKLALSAILIAFNGALALAQSAANPLASSRVFAYNDITPQTAANGAVGRNFFAGTLATGETIAVHETTQPAGAVPNPAHRIQHSELIFIQQGTLEYQHDGKTEKAGPGSILYVAFGTLHAVKNIGSDSAKYVVIQIGGDTKKP